VLGAMTVTSVAVFMRLRSEDGSAISQHKAGLPAPESAASTG